MTAVIAFILAPKNSGLAAYRQKAFLQLQNTQPDRIIEARGEDIPFLLSEFYEKGKNALGLTGEDLFNEFCTSSKNNNLKVIKRITWNDPNAKFKKPALCLLGPAGKSINDISLNATVYISAKYRAMACKYLGSLERLGFKFKKVFINGCVEPNISKGLADLVIDIVYSGKSMEEEGLEVYEKIFESNFVIIGQKEAIEPKRRIAEIPPYTPPLEGRRGKTRLDFNENLKGCQQRVLDAIRSITEEDISAYPEYSAVRGKMAKYLNIAENELILTNGSDEAIKLAIEAFVGEGDEVIIPSPTFPIFEFYAKVAGAKIREISYNEDLSFPINEVLERISNNTKLVVLVNPNNPTGTVVDTQDIERICKKAAKSLVLIDEAYWQFSGSTFREKMSEYKNVAILQTFSKAFGLAGLRIGYIISNKTTISAIRKITPPYSVNAIALKAIEAASEDDIFVREYVNEVIQNRELTLKRLQELQIKTFPSSANFILANFGKSAQALNEFLKSKGLLVRSMEKNPLLKGCLRITIGPLKSCNAFLKLIEEFYGNRGILFDMDGVLVDVSNSYRAAIAKTAEYFTGQKILPADMQAVKERGGCNNDWDLTKKIIKDKGIAIPKEKIIEKFQEFYLKGKLIDKETLLISKNVLEKLKSKFRLAIVTDRPRSETGYTLQRLGINGLFDAIVTADDVRTGKPDPQGIKLAISNLGTIDNIYIGDSIDDLQAAKSAGIEFIAVSPKSAGRKFEDLMEKNGALKTLKDTAKILEVVE